MPKDLNKAFTKALNAAGINPKKRAYSEEAYKFFLKHGASSYTPGKETREEGKKRSAREHAMAEQLAKDLDWEFKWEEDPEPYEMGDAETEMPDEVLSVVLKDGSGDVMGSLGGIGLGGSQGERRDYCRVVEAELALEAAHERKLI